MSRDVPSDAVHSGLNADKGTYKDDRHVRCKNCGFICNLDRDAKFPRGSKAGDGISHPGIVAYDGSGVTYDGTDDDWDDTVSFDGHRSDFDVGSGCPFCGTYLYHE